MEYDFIFADIAVEENIIALTNMGLYYIFKDYYWSYKVTLPYETGNSDYPNKIA